MDLPSFLMATMRPPGASGHLTASLELLLLPRLSRHIRRQGKRAKVGDERPHPFRAECAAKGGHATGTPIVDRVEQLGIRAAVAPTSVAEIGANPPAAVGPM